MTYEPSAIVGTVNVSSPAVFVRIVQDVAPSRTEDALRRFAP
jgi:hypothetical protein